MAMHSAKLKGENSIGGNDSVIACLVLSRGEALKWETGAISKGVFVFDELQGLSASL